MFILNCRSPYFQKILLTNEKKNDGTFTQIKLPNILPETFQIILKYIYGGSLSLEEYDDLNIIKILKAASEFNLEELIDFLQSFLIENKKNWMEQNFNIIHEMSFENDSLSDLQKFCTELKTNEPVKILKSPNFVSISEISLISIIQCNNLRISEVEVWDYVLKWGLAQNPELSSNPSNYTKENFIALKNTLQRCIPYIRFYNLSSNEFTNKVLPYKKIIPKEIYKDLLKYFLESGSKQSKPRTNNTSNINTKIVIPLNAAMKARIASQSTTLNVTRESEITSQSTTSNTAQESVVTSQSTTSNTAREPEVTSHSTTLNSSQEAEVPSQQTWEYEQSLRMIETPLVCTTKDIQSLYQEYEGSAEIYRQRVMNLAENYNKIRRCRSDGNSFYRAFAFAWFERILNSNDLSFCQSALNKFAATKTLLVSAGYDSFVYEDAYDIIERQIDGIVSKEHDEDMLLAMFQAEEISSYIVYYLRLVTAAYLKLYREEYEPFLEFELEMDQFCATFVEAMDQEADHLHAIALVNALNVPVEIGYMNGSDTMDCVSFREFYPNTIDNIFMPLILLYRPAHYDILYRRD
ncbi:BTB/POZ protein [Rhizophagus clarus]|nr:BTB/POZ protein [Rhizophagus clarus]